MRLIVGPIFVCPCPVKNVGIVYLLYSNGIYLDFKNTLILSCINQLFQFVVLQVDLGTAHCFCYIIHYASEDNTYTCRPR